MIDLVKSGLELQAASVKDNAKASERRWRRWISETDQMIAQHSLTNVIGAIADIAREHEYYEPEGSPSEQDWRTCADTLAEAAHKCDLRNAK